MFVKDELKLTSLLCKGRPPSKSYLMALPSGHLQAIMDSTQDEMIDYTISSARYWLLVQLRKLF